MVRERPELQPSVPERASDRERFRGSLWGRREFRGARWRRTSLCPGAHKVIVRSHGMEIYGYAIDTDGFRVRVEWDVALGETPQPGLPG